MAIYQFLLVIRVIDINFFLCFIYAMFGIFSTDLIDTKRDWFQNFKHSEKSLRGRARVYKCSRCSAVTRLSSNSVYVSMMIFPRSINYVKGNKYERHGECAVHVDITLSLQIIIYGVLVLTSNLLMHIYAKRGSPTVTPDLRKK